MASNTKYRVYMSSAGESGVGGVYVYSMDENGHCELIQKVHEVVSCQLLTFNDDKSVLYATGSAEIHAYKVNDDGTLTHLNKQPTDGISPCYVSVYPGSSHALLVNYTGADKRGSICVFPLESDGSLKPHSEYIQLEGSSVNPARQTESHPHMILPDPNNQVIFMSDLGIDKVMVYKLDAANSKLVPHDPPSFELPAGAGPRHIAFNPNLPLMYVITGLANTVNVFQYEEGFSGFTQIQEVSTLPEVGPGETHKESYCSDIHIRPDGKFLYGANRGYDDIAVFSVDSETGKLTSVSNEPTTGDWPRGFQIDPAGKWLLIANERSHDVPVFELGAESGSMTPIGEKVEITAPMWIEFVSV